MNAQRWFLPAAAMFVALLVGSSPAVAQTPLPQNPGLIVGEVRMFAFGGDMQLKQLAAQGWVECAGQSFTKSDFAALHRALESTWGSADGTNVFHLPDLRGLMLVGWHHDKKPQGKSQHSDQAIDASKPPYVGDLDAAKRWPPRPEIPNTGNMGASGNHVGSVQRHAVNSSIPRAAIQAGGLGADGGGASFITNSAHVGGLFSAGMVNPSADQTRPDNAAVLYAIYVGRSVTFPTSEKLTPLTE